MNGLIEEVSLLRENYAKYPDSMTVQDVARALNISRNTAYELVRSRKIESVYVLGQYRIPKTYFLEFLKKEWQKA